MTNMHISDYEWIVFLSKETDNPDWNKIEKRITDHVAVCSDCRTLYEKSAALFATLDADDDLLDLSDPLAFPSFHASNASSNAFVAAAAYAAEDDDAFAEQEQNENLLTVTVRSGEMTRFIVSSLNCKGQANQYALNAQNENRALVDDEKRLSLLLENGKVHITFNDPDFRCSVRLLANSENPPRYDVGSANQLVLDLPDTEFTIVEITFTEVDA